MLFGYICRKSGMHRSVSRNIPLLYITKIAKWFMLYMPAVKLFYVENNLGDTALFALHGFYSFIIFLAEVPSGYLADVIGRKRTLQIGMLLGSAGFMVYSFSSGVWGFLLAEFALGLGQSFISGADSALLYDTLLQQKKEGRYLKDEGRITAAGNGAEMLAGLTFTLLAFASMRPYYYIQTLISVAGFIAAWFLIEPVIHKDRKEIGFRDIWNTVRNTLWEHKQLSRYVLFSSVVGMASLSMAWFSQIFLFEAGISKASFGIYWALLNGMVFLGSLSAFRINNMFSNRGTLIYILVFLSGGYFLASQYISIFGIILLLVFKFVRGTAHPILKERINRLTTSDVRATVLSVRSLVIRIMFASLSPFLGYFTDTISLEFSLILCGSIILIPGILLIIAILRYSSR